MNRIPDAQQTGTRSGGDNSFPVRIVRVVQAARQIRTYELRAPDGGELPPFTPGAHVSVETPSGAVRHYSLCNDPAERDRYVIAVKREADGGGGSISLYDRMSEGDTLRISAPRNDFPLSSDASRHLLIAGGIGVTPILSMARWLKARGADFEIVFCARTAEEAAFIDELSELGRDGRITVHYDGGDPARAFDLSALLSEPDASTHVYCCGPTPMLRAVREASAHWPKGAAHFEDFGGAAAKDDADNGTFIVRVEDTDEEFEVPPDRSILEVLRDNGYDVPSSCESGTCGTCMMRLVEGSGEHRDFVLDGSERERFIMICVSRAAGTRITIGL